MNSQMTLKKLLDEISVLPGVTGSCIFDRNEGSLCKNSDKSIATDGLAKVGSYFHRILKLGKLTGLQIGGSAYRFDTCTVVCTPVDGRTLLLTVCSAKANCSLVATTAAMLAGDIQEQLKNNEAAVVGPETTPDEVDRKEEEPDSESRLQDCFHQIEEALAEAIGPVAGMILQDYIVQWQQNGPASVTRINDLIRMLGEEIQDDDLIRDFRARTKDIA